MPRTDLVLLHPPSVYDFRKSTILYGPVSDVVPSTPIFEMYPIGFVSLAEYLGRRGYRVRIVNVALKMLESRSFDLKKLVKSLNPLAFGIGLHWLVHTQGGLEIAKVIKECHPNTPVILGGLSATYYHAEIMKNHSQVDYVVRGDSGEEPLLQLLRCIEGQRQPDNVPNVSWRDTSGKIRSNPISYVPDTLDEFMLDYGKLVRSVLNYRDLTGYLPWRGWSDYPLTAVLTCRGCIYNCVMCGGSRHAFKSVCKREKPAFKSPDKVAREIASIQQYIKGPIFIVGDLRIGGRKYAAQVLQEIRKEGIDSSLVIELFRPADQDLLKRVASIGSNFNIEITPESHDEVVRKAERGYSYSNRELERSIKNAFKLGCRKLDVFFTIGLPTQDQLSVKDTLRYCHKLVDELGKDGKLHPFIAPWTPFVDPGSLVFENPGKYGYRVLFRSLEDHCQALTKPSWKYCLNYETKWMDRGRLVEITYEAASILNDIKRSHGIISAKEAQRVSSRIELSRDVSRQIDLTMPLAVSERDRLLDELKELVDQANEAILCEKSELMWRTIAKIKRLSMFRSIIRKAS